MIKRKKHSIFYNMIIPMAAVIGLQAFCISFAIGSSGIISQLEDTNISILSKSADNRQIELENCMVNDWSNFDYCSAELTKCFDSYAAVNSDIAPQDYFNSYGNELMYDVSSVMLESLTMNTTSGMFFIFSNGEEDEYENGKMYFDGVYLRNYEPRSNSVDSNEILMERGPAEIAGKLGMPLDSFWTSQYCYNAAEEKKFWDSYFKPYSVSKEHPEYSSRNSGFWNTECTLGDNSENPDSYSFITYSVPFYYNGTFIGVLGSEISRDEIESYIPAGDTGSAISSGYIFLMYDEYTSTSKTINFSIVGASGSIIKRLNSSKYAIMEPSANFSPLFVIEDTGKVGTDIYASVRECAIYNANTPFCNQKWAVAAVGTEEVLFGGAQNVKRSISLALLLSVIIGSICVGISIKSATKPISDMAKKINTYNGAERITLPETRITEINELSGTINALSERQQKIEAELREERELYLLAVKSALDIIIEYSVSADELRVYHVFDTGIDSHMFYNKYPNFRSLINNGGVCYPDDKLILMKLMSGEPVDKAEVRLSGSAMGNVWTGYMWYSVKVKPVYNEKNEISKLIGSARNINEEKERAQAAREAVRRDSVTGTYNSDFGEKIAGRYIFSAKQANIPFCLCVIDLNNFSRIEELYGMFFCDAVLSEVGNAILEGLGKDDIAYRLGRDEFAVLVAGSNSSRAKDVVEAVSERIFRVYSGESPEAKLTATIGVVFESDGSDYTELLEKAMRCVHYGKENSGKKNNNIVYCGAICKEGVDINSYSPQIFSAIPKLIDSVGGNIVNYCFNIFEKTADVRSVINVMLPKLAHAFNLSRILICEANAEYNTSVLTYSWNKNNEEITSNIVVKLGSETMDYIVSNANENGMISYSGNKISEMSESVRELLRNPEKNTCGVAFLMYERAKYSGIIIFESESGYAEKTQTELKNLLEITKIFAIHISRSRSDLASQAKSEFLSRMSHEIRTPMNAIIGMTDIAKTMSYNPDKVMDCLEKIDISTKYLLSIINDILDMSRIESGKMRLDPHAFDIMDVIMDIETLISPQAQSKHLYFSIEHNFENRYYKGDMYRINQVLINLLGNAVKFTQEGGCVTLQIDQVLQEDNAAALKFTVSDTGIGISEENIDRVFNAFEQAENSTARRFGGTGLGLAISSSIIRMMGGEIKVNSTVGKGSDFYFTIKLPVVKNADKIEKHRTLSNTEYKGFFKGKRVLLVEDNELNTEIAKYILSTAGFDVEVAVDGQNAVDTFSASPLNYYDAVLMDIRMPVMDGLEATKIIRHLDRVDASAVPIVAMTANAFDDDMKKSIASGMNGHIAKPIDTGKLLALLERLTGTQDNKPKK